MIPAFLRRSDEPVTPSFRGGTGEPLVLLHGGGMSWRAWRPVLPALTDHFDVFAPTMAGHRGGPVLPDGEVFNPLLLADYVERDLDAEGIETAHLVGNSLGGWVALELARRGRARSVVAFSPAGGVLPRRVSEVLLLQGRFLLQLTRVPVIGPRPALVKQIARLGAVLHGRWLRAEDVPGLLTDLRIGGRNLPALLEWAHQHGSIDPLVGHDYPICIAWARRDGVLPLRSYGRIVRERLPDAEVRILEGVGHVPMYDDPDLVVATIREVTAAADVLGGSGQQQGA